jgi:copper resistance protein B
MRSFALAAAALLTLVGTANAQGALSAGPATVELGTTQLQSPDAAVVVPTPKPMAGAHESPPTYYFVRVNNLDFGGSNAGARLAWDVNARFGTDEYRLLLKSEGEAIRGRTKDAELQVLVDTPISEFFNLQMGWRRVMAPVNRNFFAIGVEGLAPYFVDSELTLFVSEKGGAVARAKGAIDIPIVANIYTKPMIEVSAYTSDDRALETYAGIGRLKLALQTRYEVTRQIAPYFELGWERLLGRTGNAAHAAGERVENAYAVVGIGLWY